MLLEELAFDELAEPLFSSTFWLFAADAMLAKVDSPEEILVISFRRPLAGVLFGEDFSTAIFFAGIFFAASKGFLVTVFFFTLLLSASVGFFPGAIFARRSSTVV